MNWISPTGFSPCAAMPTHTPLISSSASGVSITRSGPKRCCSPTVARKTPPLTPTSSPSTTTSGSSSMARASARLTASTKVTSGIGRSLQLAPLAGIDARELRVEIIEHGLRRARGRRQIALDRRLDLLLALARERLLPRLVPAVLTDEIGAQPRDRLLLPALLHILGRAVARGIVGGRMVAEAVGERLDEVRALAGARVRERRVHCGAHGDHVVAVHLLAGKAGGDRLLRQGLRRGLQAQRHRDGPLVIDRDEHHRQLPYAGKIHRLPHVALGGGAVAEQADRDARLLAQLERIGDAGRMRRLRSDRNAERKIVRRPRRAVAALVAAPVEQDLFHLDAAPQQGAV